MASLNHTCNSGNSRRNRTVRIGRIGQAQEITENFLILLNFTQTCNRSEFLCTILAKTILGLSLSLKISLTGAFGLSLSISVRSLSISKTNASLSSAFLKISHRIDSETLGICLSSQSKFGLVIGPNGSNLSLLFGEIRNSTDLGKASIDLIEDSAEAPRKSVGLSSRAGKCEERIFVFNTRSLGKRLNTLSIH